MRVEVGTGGSNEVRSIRMNRRNNCTNIGNHKVESKSNVIGREDPIVMPYCRSPAPSRLSSGGYRPVNLPLAQHCFPTIRAFYILLSIISYLLQGTPRIRWPRIRLVRRLLSSRYGSHGRIPIRSLAVLARSGL